MKSSAEDTSAVVNFRAIFTSRAFNILDFAGITSLDALSRKSEAELRALRSCGNTTLNEMRAVLNAHGLDFVGERVTGTGPADSLILAGLAPCNMHALARLLQIPVNWLLREAAEGRVPSLLVKPGKRLFNLPAVRKALAERAASAGGHEAANATAGVSDSERVPISSPIENIDTLINFKQMCKIISTPGRTARRWISAGKLPPPDVRIGRAIRWRVSTIRQFIESGGTMR